MQTGQIMFNNRMETNYTPTDNDFFVFKCTLIIKLFLISKPIHQS